MPSAETPTLGCCHRTPFTLVVAMILLCAVCEATAAVNWGSIRNHCATLAASSSTGSGLCDLAQVEVERAPVAMSPSDVSLTSLLGHSAVLTTTPSALGAPESSQDIVVSMTRSFYSNDSVTLLQSAATLRSTEIAATDMAGGPLPLASLSHVLVLVDGLPCRYTQVDHGRPWLVRCLVPPALPDCNATDGGVTCPATATVSVVWAVQLSSRTTDAAAARFSLRTTNSTIALTWVPSSYATMWSPLIAPESTSETFVRLPPEVATDDALIEATSSQSAWRPGSSVTVGRSRAVAVPINGSFLGVAATASSATQLVEEQPFPLARRLAAREPLPPMPLPQLINLSVSVQQDSGVTLPGRFAQWPHLGAGVPAVALLTPLVQSWAPAVVPAGAPFLVTVTGKGFSTALNLTASFGGRQCERTSVVSDRELLCAVAPLTDEGSFDGSQVGHAAVGHGVVVETHGTIEPLHIGIAVPSLAIFVPQVLDAPQLVLPQPEYVRPASTPEVRTLLMRFVLVAPRAGWYRFICTALDAAVDLQRGRHRRTTSRLDEHHVSRATAPLCFHDGSAGRGDVRDEWPDIVLSRDRTGATSAPLYLAAGERLSLLASAVLSEYPTLRPAVRIGMAWSTRSRLAAAAVAPLPRAPCIWVLSRVSAGSLDSATVAHIAIVDAAARPIDISVVETLPLTANTTTGGDRVYWSRAIMLSDSASSGESVVAEMTALLHRAGFAGAVVEDASTLSTAASRPVSGGWAMHVHLHVNTSNVTRVPRFIVHGAVTGRWTFIPPEVATTLRHDGEPLMRTVLQDPVAVEAAWRPAEIQGNQTETLSNTIDGSVEPLAVAALAPEILVQSDLRNVSATTISATAFQPWATVVPAAEAAVAPNVSAITPQAWLWRVIPRLSFRGDRLAGGLGQPSSQFHVWLLGRDDRRAIHCHDLVCDVTLCSCTVSAALPVGCYHVMIDFGGRFGHSGLGTLPDVCVMPATTTTTVAFADSQTSRAAARGGTLLAIDSDSFSQTEFARLYFNSTGHVRSVASLPFSVLVAHRPCEIVLLRRPSLSILCRAPAITNATVNASTFAVTLNMTASSIVIGEVAYEVTYTAPPPSVDNSNTTGNGTAINGTTPANSTSTNGTVAADDTVANATEPAATPSSRSNVSTSPVGTEAPDAEPEYELDVDGDGFIQRLFVTVTAGNLTNAFVVICNVTHGRDVPTCITCPRVKTTAASLQCAVAPGVLAPGSFLIRAFRGPATTPFVEHPLVIAQDVTAVAPAMVSFAGFTVITITGHGLRSSQVVNVGGMACDPSTVNVSHGSRSANDTAIPSVLICRLLPPTDHTHMLFTNLSLTQHFDAVRTVSIEDPEFGQLPSRCASSSSTAPSSSHHHHHSMDGGACSVTLSTQGVPRISSVHPRVIEPGTLMTIDGTLLDGTETVIVAGVHCRLTQAYLIYLKCVIPPEAELPAGDHQVSVVRNDDSGAAIVTEPFANNVHVEWRINAVEPAVGSIAGGQTVVVKGISIPPDVRISIGGVLCPIATLTLHNLSCVTQRRSTLSQWSGPVEASSASAGGHARACCSYTYSMASTIVVTSIEPISGNPGTRITVNGERFPLDTSTFRLTFAGEEPTGIARLSAIRINAIIPRTAAFVVAPEMTVDGLGNAWIADTVVPFRLQSVASRMRPPTTSAGGGQTLTIFGEGFPADESVGDVEVLVCGEPCTMTLVSLTVLTCVTPAVTRAVIAEEWPVLLQDVSVADSYALAVDGAPAGTAGAAYLRDQDPTTWATVATSLTMAAVAHTLLRVKAVELWAADLGGAQWVVGLTGAVVEGAETTLSAQPVILRAGMWTRVELTAPMETAFDYIRVTLRSLSSAAGATAVTRIAEVRVLGSTDGREDSSADGCPVNVRVRHRLSSSSVQTCNQRSGAGCLSVRLSVADTAAVTRVTNGDINRFGIAEDGERTAEERLGLATRTLTFDGTGFGLDRGAVTVGLSSSRDCLGGQAINTFLSCTSGIDGSRVATSLRPANATFLSLQGKGDALDLVPHRDRPSVVYATAYALTWWDSDAPVADNASAFLRTSTDFVEGGIVVVPRGRVVVLSESTPYLTALVVRGVLRLQSVASAGASRIEIIAAVVIVESGGRIELGTSAAPSSAVDLSFRLIMSAETAPPIVARVLRGEVARDSLDELVLRPLQRYKALSDALPQVTDAGRFVAPAGLLAVTGGELTVHCASTSLPQYPLASPATAGDSFLRLEGADAGLVGTTVRVADGDHSEEVDVVGTDPDDPLKFLLRVPLAHDHAAERADDTGGTVRYLGSARVLVLTRRCSVEAFDTASALMQHHGPSVIVLQHAAEAAVGVRAVAALELTGIQFNGCGSNALPCLAFESVEDCADCTINRVAISNAFSNPAVRLVNTRGVTIERMVMDHTAGDGLLIDARSPGVVVTLSVLSCIGAIGGLFETRGSGIVARTAAVTLRETVVAHASGAAFQLAPPRVSADVADIWCPDATPLTELFANVAVGAAVGYHVTRHTPRAGDGAARCAATAATARSATSSITAAGCFVGVLVDGVSDIDIQTFTAVDVVHAIVARGGSTVSVTNVIHGEIAFSHLRVASLRASSAHAVAFRFAHSPAIDAVMRSHADATTLLVLDVACTLSMSGMVRATTTGAALHLGDSTLPYASDLWPEGLIDGAPPRDVASGPAMLSVFDANLRLTAAGAHASIWRDSAVDEGFVFVNGSLAAPLLGDRPAYSVFPMAPNGTALLLAVGTHETKQLVESQGGALCIPLQNTSTHTDLPPTLHACPVGLSATSSGLVAATLRCAAGDPSAASPTLYSRGASESSLRVLAASPRTSTNRTGAVSHRLTVVVAEAEAQAMTVAIASSDARWTRCSLTARDVLHGVTGTLTMAGSALAANGLMVGVAVPLTNTSVQAVVATPANASIIDTRVQLTEDRSLAYVTLPAASALWTIGGPRQAAVQGAAVGSFHVTRCPDAALRSASARGVAWQQHACLPVSSTLESTPSSSSTLRWSRIAAPDATAVHVPSGTTVVLDAATTNYTRLITVAGTLRLPEAADGMQPLCSSSSAAAVVATLRAATIVVLPTGNLSLEAGTSSAAHGCSRIRIVLGPATEADAFVYHYGAAHAIPPGRLAALDGATLRLRGAHSLSMPTWAPLVALDALDSRVNYRDVAIPFGVPLLRDAIAASGMDDGSCSIMLLPEGVTAECNVSSTRLNVTAAEPWVDASVQSELRELAAANIDTALRDQLQTSSRFGVMRDHSIVVEVASDAPARTSCSIAASGSGTRVVLTDVLLRGCGAAPGDDASPAIDIDAVANVVLRRAHIEPQPSEASLEQGVRLTDCHSATVADVVVVHSARRGVSLVRCNESTVEGVLVVGTVPPAATAVVEALLNASLLGGVAAVGAEPISGANSSVGLLILNSSGVVVHSAAVTHVDGDAVAVQGSLDGGNTLCPTIERATAPQRTVMAGGRTVAAFSRRGVVIGASGTSTPCRSVNAISAARCLVGVVLGAGLDAALGEAQQWSAVDVAVNDNVAGVLPPTMGALTISDAVLTGVTLPEQACDAFGAQTFGSSRPALALVPIAAREALSLTLRTVRFPALSRVAPSPCDAPASQAIAVASTDAFPPPTVVFAENVTATARHLLDDGAPEPGCIAAMRETHGLEDSELLDDGIARYCNPFHQLVVRDLASVGSAFPPDRVLTSSEGLPSVASLGAQCARSRVGILGSHVAECSLQTFHVVRAETFGIHPQNRPTGIVLSMRDIDHHHPMLHAATRDSPLAQRTPLPLGAVLRPSVIAHGVVPTRSSDVHVSGLGNCLRVRLSLVSCDAGGSVIAHVPLRPEMPIGVWDTTERQLMRPVGHPLTSTSEPLTYTHVPGASAVSVRVACGGAGAVDIHVLPPVTLDVRMHAVTDLMQPNGPVAHAWAVALGEDRAALDYVRPDDASSTPAVLASILIFPRDEFDYDAEAASEALFTRVRRYAVSNASLQRLSAALGVRVEVLGVHPAELRVPEPPPPPESLSIPVSDFAAAFALAPLVLFAILMIVAIRVYKWRRSKEIAKASEFVEGIFPNVKPHTVDKTDVMSKLVRDQFLLDQLCIGAKAQTAFETVVSESGDTSTEVNSMTASTVMDPLLAAMRDMATSTQFATSFGGMSQAAEPNWAETTGSGAANTSSPLGGRKSMSSSLATSGRRPMDASQSAQQLSWADSVFGKGGDAAAAEDGGNSPSKQEAKKHGFYRTREAYTRKRAGV